MVILKKTRLSHSSVTMYSNCSQAFDYHYNQRIRPSKGKSPLLFGNAIDIGLNTLLETKDLKKAGDAFTAAWSTGDINGVKVDLQNSDMVEYSKSDFDVDLGPTPWESLLAKGHLILNAYEVQVLPRIKEVIEVQGQSSIFNAEGDEIVTKRDLVAVMDDGKRYLLDNKTASALYAKDAAETSQQLLLYYYLEKDKLALEGVGFIVVNKNIKKMKCLTCPKCKTEYKDNRIKNCQDKTCKTVLDLVGLDLNVEIQILLNDKVNLDIVDTVIDTFDSVNTGVSNEVFEKSEGKKACFQYGRCAYYNLCWGDGSMEGLVKLEDKK